MERVLGFHIILTCYGFWLPNDPRGSNSRVVRADQLKPFGSATFTNSSRSVAWKPHDFRIRKLAKKSLKYPPVLLNGLQAQSVAIGMRAHLRKRRVACYAFAALREHVHLVIAWVNEDVHEVMIDLKAAAVHQLNVDRIHPLRKYADQTGKCPKMWATGGRHVYLFDDDDMTRSIGYVRDNPMKSGFPSQRWSFVKPFRSPR